ncbi:MAG: phage terminase large subunit, partial [Pseudomonadota bacterium]
MFGGARGGGKTDGVLGKYGLKAEAYGPAFNALALRRTAVSFDDAVRRAREIYTPGGVRFSGAKGRAAFKWPNGATLSFRHLETVADADNYQGMNVSDVWIEEVGQYPTPQPIDRLFGIMRSASGIPVQMILTGNPGGAGQLWLRERFKLHPFPKRTCDVDIEINGQPAIAAVIPSRIWDNRVLLRGDPGYLERLKMTGSPELVRAWLEGDWSAIEGAYFPEWSEKKHVCEPFPVPDHWLRFRAMDHGYATPFSVGWYAVASEDHQTSAGALPRGALVRYREWYGTTGKPNAGIRLTATTLGKGILKRDEGERITFGVIDPAADTHSNGPSIMEEINAQGCRFRRADNRRTARGNVPGGWDAVRRRLEGDEEGRVMLMVFSTGHNLIQQMPLMQHDPDDPEDMLKAGVEEHSVDELRYACMARPWVRKAPQPEKEPEVADFYSVGGKLRSRRTLKELIEA